MEVINPITIVVTKLVKSVITISSILHQTTIGVNIKATVKEAGTNNHPIVDHSIKAPNNLVEIIPGKTEVAHL